MNEKDTIRWGIIGTGAIAKTFAEALKKSRTGRLVAVATRDANKPGLTSTFPDVRILEGYQTLVDDDGVDVIYVATPHTLHVEWSIKAARAGKHVLCEKPFAVTVAEGQAMFAAAQTAGTFLGEAFMYRLHPLASKLVEVIQSGVLGEVRLIRANLGFRMNPRDPTHRLLANDAAGGAITDICGYPVSIARLIAGAAVGKPFMDPTSVKGEAIFGDTEVDEWASAVLQFPNNILAEVSGSLGVQQDGMVRIFGTEGWLETKEPYFGTGREGGTATFTIHRGSEVETITIEEAGWLYAFEIDAVADAIRDRRTEFTPPGMIAADTIGNLKVLEDWRKSVGLTFKNEALWQDQLQDLVGTA